MFRQPHHDSRPAVSRAVPRLSRGLSPLTYRPAYGPFKPNTVITVEPGIYIPEGSPCDKKWWGIAIRIEDDILIMK